VPAGTGVLLLLPAAAPVGVGGGVEMLEAAMPAMIGDGVGARMPAVTTTSGVVVRLNVLGTGLPQPELVGAPSTTAKTKREKRPAIAPAEAMMPIGVDCILWIPMITNNNYPLGSIYFDTYCSHWRKPFPNLCANVNAEIGSECCWPAV